MLRKTYSILAIARRHPRMFSAMMKFQFINYTQLFEESYS